MKSARAFARAALSRFKQRDEGFVVCPEQSDTRWYKTVLLFREFGRFQGGHLKLWHYYNHVAASGTHMPYVWFTADSLWDESNPWKQEGQRVVPANELSIEPDVYLLGARDWARIEPSIRDDSPIPVINLVQNVRHADERDESFAYLAHKAIRICIDPAVERAVLATGRVGGPVFTIQDATDLTCDEEARNAQRDVDVVIVGAKQPDIARRIHSALRSQDVSTTLIDTLVPRPILFDRMRSTKVALFLPNRVEGAYLPPVEAMSFGTIAVCPDIDGASYCQDGRNCLRPRYVEEPMIDAVKTALALEGAERESLLEEGFRTVRSLSLEAERASFLDILQRVDELW